MRISEIYRSIQGESSYAGLPCTFIRTAGCTLRCTYCDTTFALDPNSGTNMTLDEIIQKVDECGTDLVEITGGEPLEQDETPELCLRLLKRGSKVMVETSGAYSIENLPEGTISIIDLKTPSSKMESRNYWENLPLLRDHDELKFVIATREDFDWSVRVCREHQLFEQREILFSPAYPQIEPVELAQWILEEHIPVRLQLQLHKIIWAPDVRGV